MKDAVESELGKREEFGRMLKRDLFLFLLSLEVKRARRYQNFLSILILKLVREPGSHNGEALKASHQLLAGLLADETRESDILGDFAEDKFVVILPYADFSAGNQAKSRFETFLRDYDLKRNGYEVMIHQLCFPRNGTSTSDLLKKAFEEEVS